MNQIAKFETVSWEQFLKDARQLHPQQSEPALRAAYENILLPQRKTKGAAGYDFHSAIAFLLNTQETIVIPTGVRVQIEEGWFLGILPRSGHGFKFRIQLDNTLGVIDADYYFAQNQGHILVKITNDSKQKTQMDIRPGDAFAQGIFLPHGITVDDEAEGIRRGGFGSTDEKR